MEKIDKSNTFQLVLDDAVILASDEYKLEATPHNCQRRKNVI